LDFLRLNYAKIVKIPACVANAPNFRRLWGVPTKSL
jgi:hypothetical protein